MPPIAMLTLASGEVPRTTLDFLIVFATATVVTLTLRHLRVATIPAYLLAGVLVGASGLVDTASIDGIASLATILLMFGIGLHMDPKELTGSFLPVFIIGAVATVVTTLLMWPVGVAFGLRIPSALVIAMAMAMSSTAAVLRILQQRRELKSFHGRLIFATLIVQDLIAIAFLSLIPTLGNWAQSIQASTTAAAGGGAAHASGIGALLLQAMVTIGGVTAMIAAGHYLLPRLLTFAAKDSAPDMLLVVAGAVALGAAVLTSLLGLSPELGAFLAGFLLAGTPFKHQVSGQLAPMRDLFMAIFFVAVGLNLPLNAVLPMWWVVLIGVVMCVLLKTLGNALTMFLGGLSAPLALAVGASLCQAGEFTLVLLQFARDNEAIRADTAAAATGVVAVTLMLTPTLMAIGRTLAPRLARVRSPAIFNILALRASPLPSTPPTDHAPQDDAQDSDHAPPEGDTPVRVVIAGYGPVGRAVAQRLDLLGAETVIIELNPSTVKKQGDLGRRVVYGDVTNPEVLESADIHGADAFILTIPDDEACIRAVRTVRSMSPRVFIAARASFLSKGLLAKTHGADTVTIEEIATAESMADQVHAEFAKRRAARVAAALASPGPTGDNGA